MLWEVIKILKINLYVLYHNKCLIILNKIYVIWILNEKYLKHFKMIFSTSCIIKIFLNDIIKIKIIIKISIFFHININLKFKILNLKLIYALYLQNKNAVSEYIKYTKKNF